jgi:Leucine-rich repeat (LRR) protein
MTDKVTTLQLLEDLTLDNCGLSYLPSLQGMPYLLTVSVPHNRLSKIEGLMNVFRLFLYNNLFTELPTQTEPQALAVLYMNQNPVKDMTGINSFIHLVDVRLSNSSISVIPSTINELQRLSFLDVSFSRLSDLPNTILKVPELQFLVIQNNLFSAEQIKLIKTEFSTQRPDVQLLI